MPMCPVRNLVKYAFTTYHKMLKRRKLLFGN